MLQPNLYANSSATTKKTSSLGLTAALRAAATPRFNQDFHAELRKTLKRHKKPSQLGSTTNLLHVKRQCHQKDDSKCRAHSCAARSCDPSVQPRLLRRVEKDIQEANETLYSQTESATTKLLHAKSTATTTGLCKLRVYIL